MVRADAPPLDNLKHPHPEQGNKPKPAQDKAKGRHDEEPTQPYRRIDKLNIALTLLFSGLVAIFTGFSTYYSSKQWEGIKVSLEDARKTREIENRAWVGVKAVDFVEDASTKEVIAQATYVNSGGTPANVAIKFMGKNLEQSPPNDFNFGGFNNEGSRMALFPGVEYKAELARFPAIPVQPNPKSPDHAVYLFGLLEYDDAFGNHHTTRFCYRTTAIITADGKRVGALQLAPTHNTFD